MRIAIFTETYLPDINGVVTHIKILRDGLVALGHEVLIVKADADSRKNYIEKGVMHCPGIRAKRIYNYSLSSPVSVKRLRMIKRFNPDIIHIHNEFGIGLSGAFIAKMLGVPYVYTLHTMYDNYIYYVAKKPIAPIVKDASHVYLKLLAKKADAVTGPSKKVEDFFRERGVDKQIFVVPNPVELDKFSPDNVTADARLAFYEKYGFSENDTLCCFCGRLGKEKSVDVLLNFWKESCTVDKSLKLCIFGEGPVKSELEELSASLGITDSVVFTGRVEHDDLINYLASCRIYITTSLSDTYSISMLEAMASGLPVLTLKDPENEGQIRDGLNGYVFADANQMFEQIQIIKNLSDEEYSEFSQRVCQSTKSNGAEQLAKNLLEIYKSAIEKQDAQRLEDEKDTSSTS